MGIDPTKARLFVNTIVNEYGRLHNPSSEPVPEPVDIFGRSAYYENTREQQIFLERFSLPKYYQGTAEKQDKTYQKHIPNLAQLFVKTGILEPSLETKQKRLAEQEKKIEPTKKAESPAVDKGTAEKKEGEPEVKDSGEAKKADDPVVDKSAGEKKDGELEAKAGEAPKKADDPVVDKSAGEKKEGEPEVKDSGEAKKADNPAVDKGAAEKKEGESVQADGAEQKAENPAVDRAPEIDKKKKVKDGIFAQTNLEWYQQQQEALVKEQVQQVRKKHKENAIQAIVRTFLRRENCELDPSSEFINVILAKITRIRQGIASRWPQYFEQPESMQFCPEATKHFFGHIFQEVYAGSDVAGKEKIVELLKDYGSLLEESEFVWQRRFNWIEGKFSKLSKNPYFKMGISVASGIALYLLIGHVIAPFAIQFFNSYVFPVLSSAVLSQMPVEVLQISSQVVSGIIWVINYVGREKLSQAAFNYQIVMIVMNEFPPLIPFISSMILACNPEMIGAAIGKFLIHRSYGLDVRVQDRISKSLEKLEDQEKAARLLEEGLKAYQVWMYLALQGPNQNDFVYDLPPKSVSSSDETKFLASTPRVGMQFAYQY